MAVVDDVYVDAATVYNHKQLQIHYTFLYIYIYICVLLMSVTNDFLYIYVLFQPFNMASVIIVSANVHQ